MIDKELLEILACPKCKQPVREQEDRLICTNPQCGLRYPIRDGIPVTVSYRHLTLPTIYSV